MTRKKQFAVGGKPINEAPLHYTACGLDDVYLLNGFRIEDTPYGEGIAVEDVDGLHRAIGLHLVRHRKTLSPKEFRFLRKQMDLTQAELGRRLGISDQTVARYEKGETEIAGPADSLIRVLYVFSLLPEERRLELTDQIIERAGTETDEVRPHAAMFRATPEGWLEEAA